MRSSVTGQYPDPKSSLFVQAVRERKSAPLLSNEDDSPASPTREGQLAVLEAKPQTKQPPLYRVVLLNDDYTPMEFVVQVLMSFFNLSEEKATQVMLAVHTQGKGVCGIYSKDVAETKSAQVNQYSRQNKHPLLCEVEKV